MKALLLFPPGWTLVTGSPHVALPILSSFLEAAGIETQIRDLNIEMTSQIAVHLPADKARAACVGQSLQKMNEIYFDAEDRLVDVAAKFGGDWNAQLGFSYLGSPHLSSKNALDAIDNETPFGALFDRVIFDLGHHQPDVIGFCLAASNQIIPTLQLCSRLRNSGFAGVIVLGGNVVSRLAHEMAIAGIFDLVDGLIIFQGEIPLLRLCQAVQNGNSLEVVPGLIWRDNGVVRTNAHHEDLDPDSIPAPNYDDLPLERYWGERYLNLVGARGCYYGKCNFCPIPFGWGSGGYAGARSAARVYEDMLILMERHGVNRFKFVDEALSPKFMRALASRILNDGVKVEWEGYTRLESAWCDYDFVEHVGRAGFRKGYFGLEVLPSPGRATLNKRDCAQPDLLLDTCQAGGVKAHLFCMFGYPGTGEEDAKHTVDFLLKNRELIDTADIFPWTYAKHTTVQDARPIVGDDRDWALEFDHVGLRPDVLSPAEISELASRFEEIVWAEVPKFLHPTYRLISPWSPSKSTNKCLRMPSLAEAHA